VKGLIGFFIGSLLIVTSSFTLLARSCDPARETCIDRELFLLINTRAPDYYNSNWKISLSQYKAWIALITLREAGYGRYGAHSSGNPGCRKMGKEIKCGDFFPHRDSTVRGKFPFSTGIGAFQLDRGGEDGGENWGAMSTIEKLNPETSLESVLKWHFNRFNPKTIQGQRCRGKEIRGDITLEVFQLCTKWFAVDTDQEVTTDWDRITGGKCPWMSCKKEKRDDVEFDPPFTDDPFENTVKEVGEIYWNIEGLQGYFPTWCIIARSWNGKERMRYYYTLNPDTGWEFWVWKDPKMQLIYRHAREYRKSPLPEPVPKEVSEGKIPTTAGFTGSEPALQLPPNRQPIANAGSDQSVIVNSTIQLNGSSSSDPDCDLLTYTWKFISKPPGSKANLSKTNIPKPTFKADKEGDYVLELKVDDGRGGTATDQVTITARREVCKFKREIYWIGQPPEGVSQTLIDPPAPPAGASVRFSLCVEETQNTFRWVYTVYNLDFRTQEGINGLSGVRIENKFSVPFSNQFGPPGWVMQGFVSEWEWDIPSGQGIPKGKSAQFGFETAKNVGPTPSECCHWVHSWNSVPGQVDILGGGQMLIPGPLAAAASQATSSVGVSSTERGYNFGLTRGSLGIKDFSVMIFDLSGKLVFHSGWVENGFTWNLLDNRGQPLANGVYLYVITYRREDGTILRSEVKKLVILR
jgi:hypothetical protein